MKLHLFLITVAIVIGCIQTKVETDLEKAVSLFNTRPDSTLAILSDLDTSQLYGTKQWAKYSLYLSAAYDKNYIDVRSDSLIDRALAYYENHGSKRERMLSFYYKGIVLMNQKAYTSAVGFFEKAAQVADNIGDNHYLGLIYKNIGSAFSQSNNLYSSEEYYQKSLKAFLSEPGDTVYQQYARYSLAAIYVSRKEYEHARQQLESIHPGSDKYLEYHCNMLSAEIALSYDKDPRSCISLYRGVPDDYYYHTDYINLALAFERLGQRDSSDYWIDKGYTNSQSVLTNAMFDYNKSRILRGRQRENRAYDLLKIASHVQDSLTRKLLRESISSAQRDFFMEDAANQRGRLQQIRRRNIAVALIVFLLMSLLLLILRDRQKNRNLYIKELMAQLALKNKQISKLSKDNADLISTHYSERIRQLDSISTKYFLADSDERKEIVFRQFKEYIGELNKEDSLYKSIETDLNLYCDGVMTKLRAQVPKVNGRNMRVLILFFAGFSYETVALIVKAQSVSSLRTCRSRLRQTIIDSCAPDSALFLKMLDSK
jgi:tetratricopeptide (TPR) repeat protein